MFRETFYIHDSDELARDCCGAREISVQLQEKREIEEK